MKVKASEFLTPEIQAEDNRIREEIKAELPDIRARAQELHDIEMREGMAARRAIAILRHERKRLGLSDDDMIARSGLDLNTLATIAGPNANPTLATFEAYAAAVGKKLRIIFDPVLEESSSSDQGKDQN